MNHLRKLMVSVALLLCLGIAAPVVFGQSSGSDNWPMAMTMHESFRVGDLVFPPGSYFIRLTPGTVSRNVMMVYSLDRGRWEGRVMGIYTSREKHEPTGLVFSKPVKGEPMVLESWFYPHWKRGLSFANHPGTYLAGKATGNNIVAMAAMPER